MREELNIRETQAVSLEILKKVADICEQNGLRYVLQYGTLLGAVRHKGYIPWDDDVDIMMPRPDYEALLAYFKEHASELDHLQFFEPRTCKDYPYMIGRISDDRYQIDMDNEKPYGMGVFIDVYPFDGLGNSPKEALDYGLKGDRLSSFCYQATRKRYAVETTTSTLRKILKFPLFLVSKMMGKDYFQEKLSALAGQKPYDQSEYVGCVVWLSGGEKDIFPRKWFDETMLVPFEQYAFRIPAHYDDLLKKIYGDYMQLPPEEDRVGHHNYKVYHKD